MCDCDFGIAEFSNKSSHKARKEHRCSECCSLILPGQIYIYDVGKYDGEFFQIKTCNHCSELIANARRLDCFCYGLGTLYEELHNHDDKELREVNIISAPACRISDRNEPEFRLLGKIQEYAFLRFYYSAPPSSKLALSQLEKTK